MYLEQLPETLFTTTLVRIKYDCCGKEHVLKWKDADKNFRKNDGQHICKECRLRSSANPAKSKEVQDKIKKTNLERYGSSCALNSPEQIKHRTEKMFGSEESIKEIVERRRKTCQERYGVDHQMKTEATKVKIRETCQEKYGTDHHMQNEEVKARTQETVLDKYGVENVAQLPEVQAKIRETMVEKFGVEYYNQLPEMKDYLRQNCTTWLADSYENPWAKGIERPEEWNEKQRETVSRLIDEGTWKGGGKHSLKGTYSSAKCKKRISIFRSSYELLVHWSLDHDTEVEWYDYEPFQVPYIDTEGKRRHYTVDFVVKYNEQQMLLAIEVKNNYSKESDMSRAKHQAFLEVCGEHCHYEFWANDKIKSLGLKLKDLINDIRVKLYQKQ